MSSAVCCTVDLIEPRTFKNSAFFLHFSVKKYFRVGIFYQLFPSVKWNIHETVEIYLFALSVLRTKKICKVERMERQRMWHLIFERVQVKCKVVASRKINSKYSPAFFYIAKPGRKMALMLWRRKEGWREIPWGKSHSFYTAILWRNTGKNVHNTMYSLIL
jgi:hypothetical protein